MDTITDGLGELGALGVAAQVTGADAGADGVEAGALDAVGMLHQVQVAQHHNGGQQQGGGVGQILAGDVRGGTVDLGKIIESSTVGSFEKIYCHLQTRRERRHRHQCYRMG